MKNYRIYVEKKPRFRVEAESLRRELNANLGLELQNLRLLNVYDLFGFGEEGLVHGSFVRSISNSTTDVDYIDTGVRNGTDITKVYSAVPANF